MSRSRMTPNSEMPRVTFRVPSDVLDDLPAAIAQSEYNTRSGFLRAQCRELVEQADADTDANVSVDCL